VGSAERCLHARTCTYVFKQSNLGTTPHTHTLLNSTPANVKLLLGCPRICLRGAGKVSLYADFLFYFQLFMSSSPSSSRPIRTHTLAPYCSFERAHWNLQNRLSQRTKNFRPYSDLCRPIAYAESKYQANERFAQFCLWSTLFHAHKIISLQKRPIKNRFCCAMCDH
jgi:hypothetical protein